jgi:50S ribosomal protein L16 3-hydroxylase
MAAPPVPDKPLPLLGGLTPRQFMARHWQRRPLLVRQALPGVRPPVSRAEAFALAARDDVESRLVRQQGDRWTLRRGPLPRRALPPVAQPGWTVLVQGLDLHVPAARDLLDRFRFIPEARLDDLMLSWASDGGGVGPHLDSYDVFLIQVAGRRRWRIGPTRDRRFVPGLPLRILQHFEPVESWVLEPGDMLYLPPQWAHEGTAEGECMTASVGFRAATAGEMAAELIGRIADDLQDDLRDAPQVLPGSLTRRYGDRGTAATAAPGALPAALLDFARQAVEVAVSQPGALTLALGEWLTEPKPQVWFDAPQEDGEPPWADGLALAPATRMLHGEGYLFINGESLRAAGRDAALMAQLADQRELPPEALRRISAAARDTLRQWWSQGWLVARSRSSAGMHVR